MPTRIVSRPAVPGAVGAGAVLILFIAGCATTAPPAAAPGGGMSATSSTDLVAPASSAVVASSAGPATRPAEPSPEPANPATVDSHAGESPGYPGNGELPTVTSDDFDDIPPMTTTLAPPPGQVTAVFVMVDRDTGAPLQRFAFDVLFEDFSSMRSTEEGYSTDNQGKSGSWHLEPAIYQIMVWDRQGNPHHQQVDLRGLQGIQEIQIRVP